ncbi:MAG: IPT/TIG domain-containing protein [Caldilineaceae bacterium]|nr:IPT/TIG domain-containing protein [Caldilineaceae bacterium]
MEQSLSVPLVVAPLTIPTSVAPTLDGDCNDDAYAGAAHVSPQPYADGSRVSVLLLHAGDELYACFSQIKRAGGTSPGSLAVVRVDTMHDAAAQPQTDDHLFILGEDGVPQMYTGTGSAWAAVTSSGLVGRVSTTGDKWSAEVQIAVSAIGGWNHVVGMDVEHAWVNAVGDDHYWPYAAIWHSPSTWATTVWGDAPQLTSLDPVSATVGTADLTLTINGTNFADGATAQWESLTLSTTKASDTQLTAVVPAAQLSSPATITVTVVNPGMADTPSTPLPFEVRNPVPTLAQVSLKNGLLTVSGADFVEGAQFIWNGVQQPAIRKNSGELQVNEATDTLPVDQLFTVAVFNPGPGGGVSNLLTVTVVAGTSTPEVAEQIYLPLIRR